MKYCIFIFILKFTPAAFGIVGPESFSVDKQHAFSGIGQLVNKSHGPGCGITLIEPKIGITAQHCVETGDADYVVFPNSAHPLKQFKISKIVRAPHKVINELVEIVDIAIVAFEISPVREIGVSTIPITSKSVHELEPYLQSKHHLMLGYMNPGQSRNDHFKGPLRAGRASHYSGSEVSNIHPEFESSFFLNFSSDSSWHTAGDSGGPLLIETDSGYELVGVVSADGQFLIEGGKTCHFQYVSKFQNWVSRNILNLHH